MRMGKYSYASWDSVPAGEPVTDAVGDLVWIKSEFGDTFINASDNPANLGWVSDHPPESYRFPMTSVV